MLGEALQICVFLPRIVESKIMLSMVGSSGCLARSTRSSSELGNGTPRRLVAEVLKLNRSKDVATAETGLSFETEISKRPRSSALRELCNSHLYNDVMRRILDGFSSKQLFSLGSLMVGARN
jgi:hypothetical protein